MINLYQGDCIEVMQELLNLNQQVDSIVCDPPYGLQFMGNEWDKLWRNKNDKDQEYVKKTDGLLTSRARKLPNYNAINPQKMEAWHLCWSKLAYDLLKPGGFILAFSGSRTYHRLASAVEDAGFEIRDQIMWLYGSGFPKSHDAGDGWGTALKPGHEPIVVGRKPLSEKTVIKNRDKYGTGAINIDGCRIPSDGDKKQATAGRRTIKWSVNEGGSTYEKGTGAQPSHRFAFGRWRRRSDAVYTETGRFPTNVIHDGLDEEWARFFYCPKTSTEERGNGNTHPTVKPQELMRYLCRLVTPKDGIVLDPFLGSGSTGMAAKYEKFNFIGIEKEKEYFEIAEKRIDYVTAPGTLEDFFDE